MAENMRSSGGNAPEAGPEGSPHRAIYRRPEVTASISALRDLNLSDQEIEALETWVRATRTPDGRTTA